MGIHQEDTVLVIAGDRHNSYKLLLFHTCLFVCKQYLLSEITYKETFSVYRGRGSLGDLRYRNVCNLPYRCAVDLTIYLVFYAPDRLHWLFPLTDNVKKKSYDEYKKCLTFWRVWELDKTLWAVNPYVWSHFITLNQSHIFSWDFAKKLQIRHKCVNACYIRVVFVFVNNRAHRIALGVKFGISSWNSNHWIRSLVIAWARVGINIPCSSQISR